MSKNKHPNPYKVTYLRKWKETTRFFRFVVRLLRRVISWKVSRISENEELIPYDGPAIIIAPHLNEFDSILAPELVTRAGRMPRIFAKASLWKIIGVKQAFNSGKLIPVERGTENAHKSLEKANEGLKNGDTVFIFPEGTCSKDPDSWPMTCKTGAARLALMSGVQVIPILQDGAQFLDKSQKSRTELPWYDRYHKGKRVLVRLKVHEPIDFSTVFTGSIENPSEDLIRDVNYIIEDTLTSIVEESRGATAPTRWNAKLKKRISREEAKHEE